MANTLRPETTARLDALAKRYMACRTKAARLRRRLEKRLAALRIEMGELVEFAQERIDRRSVEMRDISDEILAAWQAEAPHAERLQLPSAAISRRVDSEVEVIDKATLIDTLDRLGRLDLVSETIDAKGLRQLARDGSLAKAERAVRITQRPKIQVYSRKEPTQ